MENKEGKGYLENIQATEHADSLEALKHEKIDQQIKSDESERKDEYKRSLHEEAEKKKLRKEAFAFTPHGDTLASKEVLKGAETMWPKPEKKEEKKWSWKNLLRPFKKSAPIVAVGVLAAGSLKADTHKNPEDSTLAKNERIIKQENPAGTKVDLSTARKVNELPAGYTQVKEGNKTYAYKVSPGKSIEMAKPGSNESPGRGYENWLIEQLQSGVSPDELVAKKYISPSEAEHYHQYYKPSVDVVYVENEQKADPFAAFATIGDNVFGPNRHAAAEIFYAIRDSKDIGDGGMLNTQKTDVLIRLKDEQGNFIPDQYTIIPATEYSNYYASGTNTIQSQEKLDELKKKIADEVAQRKVQHVGPDFTKRSDTVGMPGTSLAKK